MKGHRTGNRSGLSILWAVFAFFTIAQVLWLAIDQRPVAEERHYFAAARVAHGLRGTEVGRAYPDTGSQSPYPPLLAYYTGAMLALTGCRADFAVLSLLPFAWLLLWSVWKTGRIFFSGEAAAVGAALVLCFHHFVDIEPLYSPYTFINEYMLDLPLSAMLAAALYLSIRQLRSQKAGGRSQVSVWPQNKLRLFSYLKRGTGVPPVAWKGCKRDACTTERVQRQGISQTPGCTAGLGVNAPNSPLRVPNSILLGLVVGLAMLIKVNVPFYMLIAAAALFLEGYRSKDRWVSLWLPVTVAVMIALPWYLLHMGDVAGYLVGHEFNIGLALRDGMPAVGTAENLAYYLKALESMLSIPLALLVLVSAITIAVARLPGSRLCMAGIVLSYLVLTMLWGKSWRFMTPCLVYSGLAVAGAVELLFRTGRARRIAVFGLVAAVLLRMALMYGAGTPETTEEGRAVRLAPVRDDAGIASIMQDILREHDDSMLLRISVASGLRRFRHASFMQYALEHDIRMAYESEWMIRSDEWREELERSEFIVTRTGYIGPVRFVRHQPDIDRWLRERMGKSVRLVKEYSLEDNALARLFIHDRTFTNWRRLPASGPPRVLADFDHSILLTDCTIEPAGSNILVHCVWQAIAVPEKEYRLFLQVRKGWRNVISESFRPGDGLVPVIDWTCGERLAETYSLALPADGLAEDCALWLGWHRRIRRLPVRRSVYPQLLNAVRVAAINDLQIVMDKE